MKSILITGSNRGIGLELTRQSLERGNRVFATCRQPDRADDLQALAANYPDLLAVLSIDVADETSVAGTARDVRSQTDHLDLLINNAGMFERGEHIDTFDPALLRRTFDVNAVGPLIVASQFLDLLRAGTGSQIINITSQLGSLQRKNSGGNYSYDGSKAALNMLTRALAFDVLSEDITVVCVHPGWVQTDMGGQSATLTGTESAAGILALSDRLTLADTSKFFTWDGREHPW